MKVYVLMIMLLVSGVVVAQKAAPEPKRYPIFMSEREAQLIIALIDGNTTAPHGDVKAGVKFIADQWNRYRESDTTAPVKPQTPAKKEKSKD